MKWKDKGGLSRDAIKYIAMLTMALNHIANIFLPPGTFLYELLVDVGYFTAITMCYFLVEGYEYTRSHRSYMYRLLAFAVVSQIPFSLAFTENGILEFCGLNMIFTLFLCFLIIAALRGDGSEGQKKSAVFLLILVSACVPGDWGVFAQAFTLLFLRAGHSREKLKRVYWYAALAFGFADFFGKMERLPLLPNVLSTLGGMAAIGASGLCIIYLYNGRRMERGKNFSKWFFYLFYPVHLLILGLIRVSLL